MDILQTLFLGDPVSKYLKTSRELKAGETVVIPTGPHETITYTSPWRLEGDYRTGRSANMYKEELFSDQFIRENVNLSKGIFEVRQRSDASQIIAGGIDGAFASGKTVLELGSGQAIALLKFSKDYSNTIFIGIDSGYDKTKTINMKKTGVQLTNDSWKTLLTIPDQSVDTFLSCNGALTHGIYENDYKPSLKMITTLNRVAKPGAILRYDTFRGHGTTYDENTDWKTNLLRENGWNVHFSKGKTNVAIKRS
ncbi:conserved hypothetical protein [Candidatus Roizmanbacteria bacterium]|nr:conserved hypothetical protein [Candidatus Roizmanbacteria bacterium]